MLPQPKGHKQKDKLTSILHGILLGSLQCPSSATAGGWLTTKSSEGSLTFVATGQSESCMNTVEEEDAIHCTSTIPGLKELRYRKENAFQQRPDPDTFSFALSLA